MNEKKGLDSNGKPQRIYNLSLKRLDPSELDFLNTNKLPSDAGTLPNLVDLRDKMPPIINQGSIGSCTACALTGIVSHRLYLKGGSTGSFFVGSSLFLYYNERDVSRYTNQDTNADDGSTLTEGIKSLKRQGICEESLWPYKDDGVTYKKKPTNACYAAALKYTATKCYNVRQDITNMKQTLVDGNPFVIGIAIFESFENNPLVVGDPSKGIKGTGMIPMPNTTKESFLGGHAIICVGYDDTKKVWIMRNSWGKNWGDNGHFYLPYAYLLDSYLSSDIWIITQMK